MAASRKKQNVSFISKIGDKSVKLAAKKFASEQKFEWTDEILFNSEEDKARIFKDRHELRIADCAFDPLVIWKLISSSHEETKKRVAIYDTADECGLGLKATKTIKPYQFLKYPGKWSFAEEKLEDTSYAFEIFKRDGTFYGRVDGSKHRHYTTFAMHADEGSAYTFKPSARKKVAMPNTGMVMIFRPDEITVGPPFLLALQTIHEVNEDEPLLWNYGAEKYFMGVRIALTEKFFYKSMGGVMDSSCYIVNEFLVKINLGDQPLTVTYNRSELENNQPLTVPIPQTDLWVGLDCQTIQAAIKLKPNSRYLFFSKPSILTKDPVELVTWLYSFLNEELKSYRNPNTIKFFEAFDAKEYNKALRILCNSGSPDALKMTQILVRNNQIINLDPNEKPRGTQPSAFDFARDKEDFYQELIKLGIEDQYKQEKTLGKR